MLMPPRAMVWPVPPSMPPDQFSRPSTTSSPLLVKVPPRSAGVLCSCDAPAIVGEPLVITNGWLV